MSHFNRPITNLTLLHDKLGTMSRQLNYIEKQLRTYHPSLYHEICIELDTCISRLHTIRNTIRRRDYRITFETDRYNERF